MTPGEAGAAPDLEVLLVQQALQELVCRYSRAIDRRDFGQLRRLYLPDAEHDHGGLFRGDVTAFIAWLEQSPAAMRTHHFVGNALFHVDGERAEGEIYTINYHVLPASADEPARDYIAGGRYLDHYRCQDGRWYFARRQRVIDWRHQRPSAPGGTGATIVEGSTGADDPSWQLRGLCGG